MCSFALRTYLFSTKAKVNPQNSELFNFNYENSELFTEDSELFNEDSELYC